MARVTTKYTIDELISVCIARQVADRIVFIEGGVVVEEGPPSELFYNPKTERTREFLWKITELYGHDQEEGQG